MSARIPKKPGVFVAYWAAIIKPLLRDDNGQLWFCDNTANHWDESYPWKAKKTEPAYERRQYTRPDGLATVDVIRTFHRFGYHGFFKPSVAEVICQAPEEVLRRSQYFVVDGSNDAADLYRNIGLLDEGYHVALTTFFAAPAQDAAQEDEG